MKDLNPESAKHIPSTTEAKGVKWYYRPVVVILLLFLVLGPFGLPFLLKSPKFSRLSKLIITIIISVYTCYLVWISIGTTKAVLKEVGMLSDVLR